MAADQTATQTGTLTLTMNTSQTIELTGTGNRVELINHGDDTEAVYFKVETTEALADTMTGGGADNEQPLLSGERLVVNVPRTRTGNVWIGLWSAGTVTVSATLLPGGR